MHVTTEGNELVIRMPLGNPTASKTGKTLVVASTGGFVQTTAMVCGKAIKLNVTGTIAKD